MPSVPLAEAELPLVLTIDIGSSSARVLLYDHQGRQVAGLGATERYQLRASHDGASEDDPEEALARLSRCLDATMAQLGPAAERIAAVAVATIASTLLGLDQDGAPLTPVFTYADTRNTTDAASLRERLDEAEVHERTGCMFRSAYWPARLAWLRRSRPALVARVARWATLGDYLEQRLFGRGRASLSVASWTGLLSRRELIWDGPLLAALGVALEQLPPLADVDEPLQGLLPAFATRWPALRAVPWLPAIGDGAAANLGSGCTGPGQVALTVGTTGALRVVTPGVARVPAGLWVYRVDRGAALLGGATSEGGNLAGWLSRTLRLGEPAVVEREVLAVPPDGHGLTVLPFIAGERSPGWAGNARATIHGITLGTTPAEIVRASLEAVAYRFALIAAGLEASGVALEGLVASGGALLASPVWPQIIADAIGRPLTLSAETEATSRGVALLALRALGLIPGLDALPAALGARFDPDPAVHAVYQGAIARQRELYTLLVA